MSFGESAFLKLNVAYVENAVDATELLHAKQKNRHKGTRPYIPSEDIKEAVFLRGAWVASFSNSGCLFNLLSFLTLCMANA